MAFRAPPPGPVAPTRLTHRLTARPRLSYTREQHSHRGQDMSRSHTTRQIKITTVAYGALLAAEEPWVSAVTAQQLAEQRLAAEGICWPWSFRPLAFALRRLVRKGLAHERLVPYRGTAKSKEYRREYALLERLYGPEKPEPASMAGQLAAMIGSREMNRARL